MFFLLLIILQIIMPTLILEEYGFSRFKQEVKDMHRDIIIKERW